MSQIESRQSDDCCYEPTQKSQVYRPNVDIAERQDSILLYAELPGCRTEDIAVEIKDGKLELRASVPPRANDTAKLLRAEYGIGDFHRTFELSDTIDTNKIQASYKDGILTLHLPKAEAAKPRTVTIQPG